MLDSDERESLSFRDLRIGLAKLPLAEPINLTPDDFEVRPRTSTCPSPVPISIDADVLVSQRLHGGLAGHGG